MQASEAHQLINRQIDDLLATIFLVRDNVKLVERLFDQLVDELVELSYLETHLDFESGVIDLRQYQGEMASLTDQYRAVGLPHRP